MKMHRRALFAGLAGLAVLPKVAAAAPALPSFAVQNMTGHDLYWIASDGGVWRLTLSGETTIITETPSPPEGRAGTRPRTHVSQAPGMI